MAHLQAQLQSSTQHQVAEAAKRHAAEAQQQLGAAVEEAARLRAEAAGLQRQLDALQGQVADLKVNEWEGGAIL